MFKVCFFMILYIIKIKLYLVYIIELSNLFFLKKLISIYYVVVVNIFIFLEKMSNRVSYVFCWFMWVFVFKSFEFLRKKKE